MDNRIKVTPIKNGPLMAEGKIQVKDETGKVIKESDKLFFCRCGHSHNKPFCDGSHKKAGFTD